MAFTDHKIAAFTHKITDLADQPNLPPDELKARFDSSPEELRQAVNAICDESTRLDERVSGIVVGTFGDAIPKSMLSDELVAELDAKAVETTVAERLAEEATAREALAGRLTAAETTLDTHTTQIAQKCEVYFGTYVGNANESTGVGSQFISVGFAPKAVMVLRGGTEMYAYTSGWNHVYGGLAMPGFPARFSDYNVMEVSGNGFYVYSEQMSNGSNFRNTNDYNRRYYYLAFK